MQGTLKRFFENKLNTKFEGLKLKMKNKGTYVIKYAQYFNFFVVFLIFTVLENLFKLTI